MPLFGKNEDGSKKKFTDTKTWNWLENNAPEIGGTLLKTAGDLSGIELLVKAGELIDKDEKLSPQAKLEALKQRQLDIQEYQIEVQDRESARQREIEMAKTGKADWFMYVVGAVGLLAFILLVWAILFKEVPASNKEVFIHLIGIVEGVAMTIFAYYFGTSKSSNDKTKLISNKNQSP